MGLSPLVIEGPLPARALSPNGNIHWRRSQPARSEQRVIWKLATLRARLGCSAPPPARVRVSVDIGTKGAKAAGLYQPRDATNALAALEGAFDGVVDGGAAIDDSARHRVLGTVALTNAWGPGVRITIEEAE